MELRWSWRLLLPMLLLGALVQSLTYWFLCHQHYSEGTSRGVAIWLMLISFWIFLRKHPNNARIHFGIYVALSLVVATCAVFLVYYL